MFHFVVCLVCEMLSITSTIHQSQRGEEYVFFFVIYKIYLNSSIYFYIYTIGDSFVCGIYFDGYVLYCGWIKKIYICVYNIKRILIK